MEVPASNFGRTETIYNPPAPALKIGPLIVASRADLVPSTDPLEAANVELSSGWTWTPPSSATPSSPNPTAPVSNPQVVYTFTETQGTAVFLHVPIIDASKGSIVTVDADGTTTLDENSATTTAADLSKYVSGTPSSTTVSANGTITVDSSASATSNSTTKIDTKA